MKGRVSEHHMEGRGEEGPLSHYGFPPVPPLPASTLGLKMKPKPQGASGSEARLTWGHMGKLPRSTYKLVRIRTFLVSDQVILTEELWQLII